MKNFPLELLLVLFVLAVALVQFLLKLRRARRQSPLESAQDEIRLDVPEPAWGRAPPTPPVRSVPSAPGIRFGRSAAATASIPPPRGRFARRALMGNRRGMQNAIVIAAIVGPCRALDPYDIQPIRRRVPRRAPPT